MPAYGENSQSIEWSKWLVFKLGTQFGFANPLLSTIVGMIALFLGVVCFRYGVPTLMSIPILSDALAEIGLTSERLAWVMWLVLAAGAYSTIACWCRVAVICLPDVFDRYKIKNETPLG